jgi:hypothetical protein
VCKELKIYHVVVETMVTELKMEINL